jgi:Protein of unknown function (DUF1493)
MLKISLTIFGLGFQAEPQSSLSTKPTTTVGEDVYELIDKYAVKFNVGCSNICWKRYFPKVVLPFLPNAIWPTWLKSDRHKPEPFCTQCYPRHGGNFLSLFARNFTQL